MLGHFEKIILFYFCAEMQVDFCHGSTFRDACLLTEIMKNIFRLARIVCTGSNVEQFFHLENVSELDHFDNIRSNISNDSK